MALRVYIMKLKGSPGQKTTLKILLILSEIVTR